MNHPCIALFQVPWFPGTLVHVYLTRRVCLCTLCLPRLSVDFYEIYMIDVTYCFHKVYWNSSNSDSKWRIWRPFCISNDTLKNLKNQPLHVLSSNLKLILSIVLCTKMTSFVQNKFKMADISAILSRYTLLGKHIFHYTNKFALLVVFISCHLSKKWELNFFFFLFPH